MVYLISNNVSLIFCANNIFRSYRYMQLYFQSQVEHIGEFRLCPAVYSTITTWMIESTINKRLALNVSTA